MSSKRKNKELFDLKFDEPESVRVEPQKEEPITGRRDTLSNRSNSLAKIASGEMVNKTLHWVDPARCKMWDHHNRRYELLNESRCDDLIVGIQAQGKQEFPAIVRNLKGDPSFDYEVICGARRHWAVSHLRSKHYDFKFLIEIRDLDDEEAFRLSDIENRDREDISDYERAEDYHQALEKYYGSLSQMAKRLEVRVDWLSRYLDLVLLPQEVVELYPDVTQIRTRHARGLKPYLKSKKGLSELKTAATAVNEAQNEGRASGQAAMDGSKVFQLLKVNLEKPRKTVTHKPKVYVSTSGDLPMLEVDDRNKKALTMKVHLNSGVNKEEMLVALNEVLDQYL